MGALLCLNWSFTEICNLDHIEYNEPGLILDMTCSVYFQMICFIILL